MMGWNTNLYGQLIGALGIYIANPKSVSFWNRTGTVEPNRRKSNSLWTVGTVNRWNRVQNRTGGTGTVLPSPNKLIGKVVYNCFLSSMKKANMGFFIINCMHWQFQEALVFRVQLSPLFESRCSWNRLRETINLLHRKNKHINAGCSNKPNRTEIDQEPQEPKPNMNRTGPIVANTRNRKRTKPKPHWK